MGRIPQEVIDRIRMTADIVDVVGSYIPLKKMGRDYKACCPFHQEKTPSFTVNVEKQWYHCFGCGKHGNAIGFVMERENVDFVNAIRILASRYNIFIPEEDDRSYTHGSGHSPSEPANVKERLYKLYELACEFYVRELRNNPESAVGKYLKTRLLPEETVRKFSLGASPDSWDALMKYAKSSGFSDEELVSGGIVVPPRDGTERRLFDRFRNRLMFPIWNEQGRVVAFSARAVEKEFTGGKYINSPETPLFHKSRILYALHFARAAIGEKGFAILCEGQLDVIAMHRAGFENSIAPQGTAFTQEQAAILKRYTNTLCLATDSDKAGTAALFKDAAIALPLGFELRVIRFPGGKDPDELLKNEGESAIASAVSSARDFFDFALEHYSQEYSGTPSGRAKTAQALLDYVKLLETEASQSSYVLWIAEKLHLTQESLMHDLSRMISRDNRQQYYRDLRAGEREKEEAPPQKTLTPSELRYAKTLETVFRTVTTNSRAAEIAMHEITKEMLDSSDYASAIETVIESEMLDEWSEAPARILESFAEKNMDPAISAWLMGEHDAPDDIHATETMNDCIRLIRLHTYEMRSCEIRARFLSLPPEDPERKLLAKELMELSRSRALALGGQTGLVPVPPPAKKEEPF